MADKIIVVEGRQFRTELDRKYALKDQALIKALREKMETMDIPGLKQLQKDIANRKYHFETILGEDFFEEVGEEIKRRESQASGSKNGGTRAASSAGVRKAAKNTTTSTSKNEKMPTKKQRENDPEIEAYAQELLRKREKRRKTILMTCSILAVLCLGYFGIYSFYEYRTSMSYQVLNNLKEKTNGSSELDGKGPKEVTIHYTEEDGTLPEVLDEYKDLVSVNSKLIGWVKIENTYIDYPVMQTTDNEYYLTHNMKQEYDKNGTIFMDKDCSVVKPSTNYILYGHHMKSGRMFGSLSKYEKESYYEDHKYITFDSIYEKGTYQVMYVFRSKLYTEQDVNFKYYQFIDANSELEFDSYMQEMAAMSYYDTGVTASYGDRLLTLSTCDYEETNGRFVVVAKRIN